MAATLTRWDPFQQIAQAQREIDRVFGRMLPGGGRQDVVSCTGHGYRAERTYRKFSRSFMMPEDVSEDEITATFRDGELKVTLPRPTVETPHTIEITN
jgi:Hsp20/alpha crystallin family